MMSFMVGASVNSNILCAVSTQPTPPKKQSNATERKVDNGNKATCY